MLLLEYRVTCFHFELLLLLRRLWWLEHLPPPLVPLLREQSVNIDTMSDGNNEEVIDIIEWLLHGLHNKVNKPTWIWVTLLVLIGFLRLAPIAKLVSFSSVADMIILSLLKDKRRTKCYQPRGNSCWQASHIMKRISAAQKQRSSKLSVVIASLSHLSMISKSAAGMPRFILCFW